MVAPAVVRGVPAMDRKIISISSKRQITIPQKFFNLLGFENEAECVASNKATPEQKFLFRCFAF